MCDISWRLRYMYLGLLYDLCNCFEVTGFCKSYIVFEVEFIVCKGWCVNAGWQHGFLAQQPNAGQGRLIFEVPRSHWVTQHSRYDSSGRVIGPSQRTSPNTQHSQETDIHTPGGIRTRSPSKRVIANPCLSRIVEGARGHLGSDPSIQSFHLKTAEISGIIGTRVVRSASILFSSGFHADQYLLSKHMLVDLHIYKV
jgi:hypothetical protein